MKQAVFWFLMLSLGGAVIGIGFGFLGWMHTAFDTFAHFRLHLSIILVFGFFVLLFVEKRIPAVLCLIVGLSGIYTASSGTPLTASANVPRTEKPVHKMVHFNLFWLNEQTEKLVERISEIDPLFISFTEASSGWQPELEKIRKDWPYVAHCPEFDVRGGIMLFSKLRMDSGNDFCGDYGSFMKTSVFLDDGSKIDLGSVHARWPWPASGPRQYQSFQPVLKGLGDDALIAGDFNATTWSYAVRRFAEAGNLGIVSGIGATWFFGTLPAPLIRTFGLPIDNVMHKGRIRVLSAQSLESWGSDHLPVLIRFQID